MLARYKIPRGVESKKYKLPRGIRQGTRYYENHCFSPTEPMVDDYLESPSDKAWKTFGRKYSALLERRFKKDPKPFEDLRVLATGEDVFLGCSCPTKKNPDVNRCHTVLALRFMKGKFPRLRVVFP